MLRLPEPYTKQQMVNAGAGKNNGNADLARTIEARFDTNQSDGTPRMRPYGAASRRPAGKLASESIPNRGCLSLVRRRFPRVSGCI
jgi:hypothetical protein